MREPNSEEEDGGDDCRVPDVLQSLEGRKKKKKRGEEGVAINMCKAKMMWTDVNGRQM